VAEQHDDVLVSPRGHLDLHQLAVDELAQVVFVESDEVVPRVRGRGDVRHAGSMPHDRRKGRGRAMRVSADTEARALSTKPRYLQTPIDPVLSPSTALHAEN
jgi:hypothetical protein